MNKSLFASAAIFISITFSPSAFAESTSEMTTEAVIASSQDYITSYTETAQPRRSALFALILDNAVNQSTMASKSDSLLKSLDNFLLEHAVL